MIDKSMLALEFDKIKEMLCNNAVSEEAKNKLSNLSPILNESELKAKLSETTEARQILDVLGHRLCHL